MGVRGAYGYIPEGSAFDPKRTLRVKEKGERAVG